MPQRNGRIESSRVFRQNGEEKEQSSGCVRSPKEPLGKGNVKLPFDGNWIRRKLIHRRRTKWEIFAVTIDEDDFTISISRDWIRSPTVDQLFARMEAP